MEIIFSPNINTISIILSISFSNIFINFLLCVDGSMQSEYIKITEKELNFATR